MPSTEFFGYTVTNIGPLTTTFTAPSSCSTGTDFYLIAPSDGWSTGQYGRPNCAVPTLGKCFASGEALDEIAKSQSKSLGQGYLPYFSPGLYCPSGWITVGTADHGAATLNRQGFFTNDQNTHTLPEFLPLPTLGVDALEPSETLVWCCPSGHTANEYGACVSSVGPRSSFSYSEACAIVFGTENVATVTSFDGSTWNPPLLSVEKNTAIQLETLTVGLTDGSHSDAVVVNSVPPVILVYQPTDVRESGGGSGKDNGNGSSGGNDDNGNKGDDDNSDAAPIFSASLSLGPMAAVAIGLLAGIGVLAPW